jgi:uncharacterized protein YunC (DUF1805 family)
MMRSQAISLTNGKGTGYVLDLGNAPLLIITTTKGYLMCGYLNISAANKLGDLAGRVTGVKTFDDMLHASVVEISDRARKQGLRIGMSGQEFLDALL